MCSTYEVPRIVTFLDPENRMAVAKAGGRGDWEVNGFIGTTIGKKEKNMVMDSKQC